MRTLRTFLLEVHFLHIFVEQSIKTKNSWVFSWLWVKKEKSGLCWGAITLQDSFLCFLGKNDESPFLNFFSPSEFTLILSTNISISAITVSILFMLVLCNLSTDEMEFEISSDQRTGKPIACRVVRLEAGSVSFEVCYLTPKITRYSKCKVQEKLCFGQCNQDSQESGR